MSEFLKGNFTPKKQVEDRSPENPADPAEEFRKQALNSIGGSMVYVERTRLDWDGDDAEEDR